VLDAASPLPLYHQLAEELLAQIRSGSYGPGQKLPSEHALAARYGVGRPTVRQATDSLVQRGLLVRRQGSGTFVRQVPAQVDLFSLAGTLVSFERGGVALATRLLGRPKVHVIDDATHPLHGREATRVMRLSKVDETPVLLEEIDLDAEHFPAFSRIPLQGRSLSEVVEQRYRLRPQCADQTFRVTRLDAARAASLALARGAPVLAVDRTLHFPRAERAIFARMFCRTDRLMFSQRLQGNQHA
jgi:GntR family transcriptional regulator